MMHPFTSTLLQWYAAHGRVLAWRGLRDPYAVWVSEIILQQTRVAQGSAYWQRFMQRFPTVESLAGASEDEVLRLWQGLGYYSRARNLHAAARQIVGMGRFPDTFDDLRKLRGVGEYTAAAIASMAFGRDEAAVDGNVYRVLARCFGLDTPIDTTQGRKEFRALAVELLPAGRAADYNQSLMDFGSLVCTPAAPRCHECPLSSRCEALRCRQVESLPRKSRRVHVEDLHLIYIYIRHDGQTALRRRPAGGIWHGLWEPFNPVESLPHYGSDYGEAPLLRRLHALFPSSEASPDVFGTLRSVCRGYRHQLTHRRILADCYLWEPSRRPQLPDEYVWTDENQLPQVAMPVLVTRLLSSLSDSKQSDK